MGQARALVSFAQNFEDVMLWRALRHVTPGFFVDVGAQDPVVDSVSHLFSDFGWKGIHVEPHPKYAQALREQRPDDLVIQTAVGAERGVLDFFTIDGTGISTLVPEIARQNEARGFTVQRTVTPVMTLDDVFETAGGQEVHWLKIDVEGFAPQVLAGWKQSATRPWVVVIESTLPLTQTSAFEHGEPLLTGKGYEFVYGDGLNRFCLSREHPALKASFAAPPNVFDGFRLSRHANSPLHLMVVAQKDAELANVKRLQLQQRLSLEAELGSTRLQLQATPADRLAREKVWTAQVVRTLGQLVLVLNHASARESERQGSLLDAERRRADAAAAQRENAVAQSSRIETLQADLDWQRRDTINRRTSHGDLLQAMKQERAIARAALLMQTSEAERERQNLEARCSTLQAQRAKPEKLRHDLEARHSALQIEAEGCVRSMTAKWSRLNGRSRVPVGESPRGGLKVRGAARVRRSGQEGAGTARVAFMGDYIHVAPRNRVNFGHTTRNLPWLCETVPAIPAWNNAGIRSEMLIPRADQPFGPQDVGSELAWAGCRRDLDLARAARHDNISLDLFSELMSRAADFDVVTGLELRTRVTSAVDLTIASLVSRRRPAGAAKVPAAPEAAAAGAKARS